MRSFSAAVLVCGLSACTYAGGDMGDPVTRKFHWFSYVAGDDLRASCTADAPDRYRVIYNAVYERQVRMYQVDSLRRIVDAKATDGGNLAEFDAHDLAAPWRAKESTAQLEQAGYDALVGAFAQSGMFDAPPVGLDLPSRSFFWTAAYCRNGKYGFTAWKNPSPQFAALTFPALLFAADSTGVAPAPAIGPAFDPQIEDDLRSGRRTQFMLKVGADGMVR